MRMLFVLFFVITSVHVYSQEKVWVMNPTKDDARLFMRQFYQFKDFRNGLVVFTDSSFVTAKLNYHRFADAVHFISEKGDTLTIKNPKSILFTVMGRDTFYFHKDGFVQKITSNTNLNLGIKSLVQYIGKDQRGLYDSYNSVSSIDNLSNFSLDNQLLSYFTEDANYKFRPRDFFFFIDSANRFYPVKKSTLLELLPEHAKEITQYVEENKIDFEKQQSLLQLMWFLKWL